MSLFLCMCTCKFFWECFLNILQILKGISWFIHLKILYNFSLDYCWFPAKSYNFGHTSDYTTFQFWRRSLIEFYYLIFWPSSWLVQKTIWLVQDNRDTHIKANKRFSPWCFYFKLALKNPGVSNSSIWFILVL